MHTERSLIILTEDAVERESGKEEYVMSPGRSTVDQLRSANAGSSNMFDNKSIMILQNKISSLQSFILSLQTTAGNGAQPANTAYAATGPARRDLHPEAYCKSCRHKHMNKECFKQHPELKNKDSKRRKDMGKRKTVPTDGHINENSILVAYAHANENPTIYDTGALHHLVAQKKLFSELKLSPKPFKFDQAVGAASLELQGNAQLNFAGRLERLSNIFADFNKSLLIQKRSKEPNRPIARLVRKNDVFYIRPLNDRQATNPSPIIAAPSVTRTPKANAQRWHQRLGHVGQNILKKIAECSKGLEGISMNDLTTCETCHLSKAQRYVSRDPRLTPNEPLDEIFIDTVGKISTAINGQQYVVIITDARTRMRWALITKTKDQIAPLLVQWIEAQHHQYGKRVRAIFRDGGSEFFRIKDHCDRHGTRTEISAPDTPEQNGVSESSNKSLNQPHTDKINFSNMPQFGCRAYKLISHKPGKFEPRAEKGWFLGFQQNTSKNLIIYHPQRTPSQGLRWILSFTSHMTFNEDVMFGDISETGNRQQSSKDCTIPFPIFIAPTNSSTPPLTRNRQTESQFEGEHQQPPSEGLTTEPHPAEDITTEPPLSEDVDMTEQYPLEDINMEPLDSESMILDPPSQPEDSLIHPVSTECTPLLPTKM
ncbi:hypothetical protein K3495_g4357 [Podosphaera aphanis]|nr:hypothetical protein K3495_g4357 [Podosphaera aphanis]